LSIKKEELLNFKIIKKAIDSRKKNDILFIYSVNINTKNNEAFFAKISKQ
jgi:uncharacterized FAD-dependent dehydrogenase